MTYKFSGSEPIYLQLANLIKSEIINKSLKPGEKLKSVREYSAIYKVNPNTVQKALAELEADGLIYTDRTNGKFVFDDNLRIEKCRYKEVSDKVKEFFAQMKNLGFDKRDIVKIINKMGDSNE